jgi:hypothetical protein
MRFAFLALSAAALATLAGCSDPPLVIPDGAFTVSTIQDMPQLCMIAGHTAKIGDINDSQRKTVVANAEDGAIVSCAVSGTSDFTVTANIVQGDKSLSIGIASIKPGATLASPASGTIGYSSVNTAGNVYGGKCNYYFTPNTDETVASGRIWVSFQCPALQQGMSTCPIQQGYAIFENCSTIPADDGS